MPSFVMFAKLQMSQKVSFSQGFVGCFLADCPLVALEHGGEIESFAIIMFVYLHPALVHII